MGLKLSSKKKFREWSTLQRRKFVVNQTQSTIDKKSPYGKGGIRLKDLSLWIENSVGVYNLPLGIADNFIVNGKRYMVPMCTEEPSVIAAACFGAKLANFTGGFNATMNNYLITGEILLTHVPNKERALDNIIKNRKNLLDLLQSSYPRLYKAGGGCRTIDAVELPSTPTTGNGIAVQLSIDCLDTQGNNLASQLAETAAILLQKITQAQKSFSIASNLSPGKVVQAFTLIPIEHLKTSQCSGTNIAKGMLALSSLATIHPSRACTHNKGILNGTEGVVIALGNDPRANAAGAHAYASKDTYQPLSKITRHNEEFLKAEIKIPISVGIKGGTITRNESALFHQKLMDVSSSKELAMVIACVGLATNIASLRAIASDGISHHHLKFHYRNTHKI